MTEEDKRLKADLHEEARQHDATRPYKVRFYEWLRRLNCPHLFMLLGRCTHCGKPL